MLPALELTDITKTFTERTWRTMLFAKTPKRTEALKGVSLAVQPGEICGLLGPNGAGKTTLIKILATLILPDDGMAKIYHHDLCRNPAGARRMIGLVNAGERSFYWRLTGRQNLDFFAVLYNIPGSARKRRVAELLDQMDLNDKADTPYMKYSTGQQQRLAVARALLNDPQILLMDEPTKSLDPVAASQLCKLTKEELVKKQGKTVLWCTHNLKEAEEVCDRLAIIHRGKIIASGSLNHMHSLIEDERLYQLKIETSSRGSLEKTGISPVHTFQNNGYVEIEFKAKEADIPSLLNRLVTNGASVYTCKPKEIDLEEIFERLIHEN